MKHLTVGAVAAELDVTRERVRELDDRLLPRRDGPLATRVYDRDRVDREIGRRVARGAR